MNAHAFLGEGEEVDSQGFLADLEAVEVIEPDRSAQEQSAANIEVDVPVLNRIVIESHYQAARTLVLQTCGSCPSSILQTVMGKELQLRQDNFSAVSERW